jgi:inner membrane protein
VDPLSQGALGAALAATPAPRQRVAAAVAAGALSGMAPDLDVLIRSASDPLLFLEYHRQFTHALAFVPVGAALCALLLFPLLRRWLPLATLFGCCLLGYGSHGLLDACTSYGTQLGWPFSDARVAWNRISVVDPLFTLPLLILVALAIWQGRRFAAVAALWAVAYLTLGAWQGWRAEQAAWALAAARGHVPERLIVKPSFGNLLVWKSVYLSDGTFHVDAVRLGRRAVWYPGTRIARLEPGRDLPWLEPGSVQARALERFRRFSDDHLALDPDNPGLIADIRYSVVPNRAEPLWGIRLVPDSEAGDRPVQFVQNSRATAAQREALWTMIRGAPEA